ncbi:alpha/beta fold hydrolase [Agrilutibacter solisilvae]|uniref:Alpha/beta hydrolase n=1 Tax=Agrilutibacter solisilvae TaxID=2763317 RepID=A0A975AU82_9GAMM|nr:alpha/beta hydrolase [Lysobacter solisilvae]QSX79960.1 alpha/beta hydrolase [Lysobacter solisilvae]
MREFALDTAFGRLTGLRGGTAGAPRVLALHGWLDNAASFVPLAAHLPDMELVALDLPGHGASAHLPLGADYSLAGTVHAVLDVADLLGWDRFALLAHSMGAAIGSILSAAAPERVSRFLAIEALGALSDTADHTAARLRESVAARRALVGKRLRVFPDIATAARARMQANGLSEPVARLLVERGLVPVNEDGGPAGFSWSTDPRLTITTAVRMIEDQVSDLLAHIECPTRVIYADPPPPYFPEALRRSRAALLRRGEVVVLPGSHHLHMEDPAAVAAAIGDFLNG